MLWVIARTRMRPSTRPTRSHATSLASIFRRQAIPIQPSAPPPTSPLALLLPGGVQPDLYTPTAHLVLAHDSNGSFRPNTSLSVGYVGNHGYHEIIGADANAPVPVVCPASPCPATFPTTINPGTSLPVWGALAGTASAGGDAISIPRAPSRTPRSPIPGRGSPKASVRTTRCKWT